MVEFPRMAVEISRQPVPGSEAGTAPWVDLMSEGDERYRHPQVAPLLLPSAPGPLWAERCYLAARLGPDLQFGAGRAVYPHGGRRTGLIGVATGGRLHAVRLEEPFALADDPDDPQVGPLRIEVVRPLRELRIVLDEPGVPLGLDLRFEARGPAVPTDRNVIVVRDEVVTDYMNFYQSGCYSGTVSIGGEERRIERVLGFRDRGWGMRKHEGSPRRGLVLFGAHEFPDCTLWYLLYETASGRRTFTNGWLASAARVEDTVTQIEHDLAVDEAGLCTGGVLRLSCASGRERVLEFEVDARMYLEAIGYSAAPDWPPFGYTEHDTSDPANVARLNGQNDNGGPCRLDGVDGHGFIETGIGVHPRYRPATAKEDAG
jgi:hypothetical protein